MQKVLIRTGEYNKMPITNEVFTLVKGVSKGKNGSFVTVAGTGENGYPERNIRIKVKTKDDIELQAEEKKETDEEVIERLRERFQILEDMSYASCDGVVRGMVVTGPQGVGKSYGVEKVIREAEMMNKMWEVLATRVVSMVWKRAQRLPLVCINCSLNMPMRVVYLY